MRHGFRSTDIIQSKVFGPPNILELEFADHTGNGMFVELSKWPASISAKEVKQKLVDSGITMYLLDNEGNVHEEIHSDLTVIKDKT